MNSYSPTQRSHISSAQTHPPVQRTKSSSYTGFHLFTALSIITLVGSLIAAGVLYSHIGTTSLWIGGIGAFVGSALLIIVLIAKKNSLNNNFFTSQSDVPNMNPANNNSLNLTLYTDQTETPSDHNPMLLSNLLNTTPSSSSDEISDLSDEPDVSISYLLDTTLSSSSDEIIDLTGEPDVSISYLLDTTPSSSSDEIIDLSDEPDVSIPNLINTTPSSSSNEIIDLTGEPNAIPTDSELVKQKSYKLSETDLFPDDFLIDYSILLSTKYPKEVSIPRRNKEPAYLKDLSDLEDLQQRILEHVASKTEAKNTPFFLNVEKSHWTLILINQNKRHIEYYDSFKNYGDYEKIDSTLKETATILSEQDPNETPYKFIPKIKEPLQNDGYQCGAWALYFLEKKLEDSSFDPNSLPSKQRSKIIAAYRSKVIDQLNEMNDKLNAAEKEEKSRYKNKQTYREDKAKSSIVELWQNRLNGKLLTPSS